MPQDDQASSDPNRADKNEEGVSHAGLWRILLAGAILLVALLFLSVFLPNMSERIKFFTVNALSLLVLVAIAVQAYIYRRQWAVMKEQMEQAKQQTRIMGDSLIIETRSYVGIHSIETELTTDSQPRSRTLIVRIENIGKVPAEDIKVSTVVSMWTPNKSRWAGNPRGFYSEAFNNNFRHAKLFPGSLKFEIRVPLLPVFSLSELILIAQQISIFTVSVKIEHNDGFNAPQQSEFFFHYLASANQWIPRAVVSPKELEKEQADESVGE